MRALRAGEQLTSGCADLIVKQEIKLILRL